MTFDEAEFVGKPLEQLGSSDEVVRGERIAGLAYIRVLRPVLVGAKLRCSIRGGNRGQEAVDVQRPNGRKL